MLIKLLVRKARPRSDKNDGRREKQEGKSNDHRQAFVPAVSVPNAINWMAKGQSEATEEDKANAERETKASCLIMMVSDNFR